ncbi:MAG: hypothetical protein K0R57_1063 [Paenibacillaceae bacterium]|jgi:hypothetical protein|nr:hypothetical protein [Paenibacillaceae bacterium]
MLEHLRVARYHYILEAGEQGLDLPPWKASTFRGGFGNVFKKLACIHPDLACRNCAAASYCAYVYVFETRPDQGEGFMSKYDQVPRPYLLEVPVNKQTWYEPQDLLDIYVVLFGKAIHYAPLFVSTFQEMGRQGIGKGKRSYKLIQVENITASPNLKRTVYSAGGEMMAHQPMVMSEADWMSPEERVDRVNLFFETPLRLKTAGSYTDQPEFSVIFRSVLRRVTSILKFHHGMPTEAYDYKGLVERAQQVKLIRHSTKWVDYDRYSSRQDEHMRLGGIMGWAQYEGEMTEFLPWLRAAEQVHIGKNAVFDLGRIRVSIW